MDEIETNEAMAPALQESDGVIRLGGSNRQKKTTEMVPLFAINGKTYKIPKKVSVAVALSILDEMKREGATYEIPIMLRRVLGQEAYDALLSYDDLETDDFEAIMKRVQDLVFSAAEKPQGN